MSECARCIARESDGLSAQKTCPRVLDALARGTSNKKDRRLALLERQVTNGIAFQRINKENRKFGT